MVTVEGWLGLGVGGVQESIQSEIPPASEEFGGSGVFVEFVAQSEEVGQGVELVFAFVNNRGFICWMYSILLAVACCLDSTGWRGLERVAVGRLNDELSLRVYGPEDETVESRVLLCQCLVACQLICRVAQPLCVNVPSHDESLSSLPLRTVSSHLSRGGSGGRAIDMPANGCVQCVRESIAKQLSHVFVYHARGHIVDDLLYCV